MCRDEAPVARAVTSRVMCCLIPVGWSISLGPIVSAGYGVVCEVFAGGMAGLLHDGALWLRPPRVRGRIVGGLSRLATQNAGSPRPTSRRGHAFLLLRNRVVSSCSLPSSTRSVLSRRLSLSGRPARLRSTLHVPLSQTGSELLFDVFSRHYENGATIVTSNLPSQEWTSVFASEHLTGALLDCITHHVHILEMNAESYRLKQSRSQRRRPSE